MEKTVDAAARRISCPACSHFIMQAHFEGVAEVNCSQARCKEAVRIEMDSQGTIKVSKAEKPGPNSKRT